MMYKINDIGFPGKFVTKLVEEVVVEKGGWEKFQTLTRREKEILKLVASGYTNKEIGKKLFVSDLTIKTHRKNIMHKLEAKNLAEVIRFAHVIEILENDEFRISANYIQSDK